MPLVWPNREEITYISVKAKALSNDSFLYVKGYSNNYNPDNYFEYTSSYTKYSTVVPAGYGRIFDVGGFIGSME